MERATIEISKGEAKLILDIMQRCLNVSDVMSYKFKTVISKECKRKEYTLDSILKPICEYLGVSEENARGENRKREYCDCRAIVSTITHELWPKLKLWRVGSVTNKSHSSVIHHFWKVENIAELNKTYHNVKLKLGIES